MSNTVIQVESLAKAYGSHRGIEDISFTVAEGEIFGFIGPNGAGKSTTIRTLLALIRPNAGSASIFGLDCIDQAPTIARDVGYLPGEVHFYERMRVGALLRYTAELYGKNCDARTAELSQRLQLDLTRKIADLSLGNRKKVGIVCALLHSPKLVILDEPTSGLDPLMQQVFYDLLLEENRRGTTVFFSSHVLREVQKLCGRVAILKEGRLIGLQSIQELRENGYKKVSLTANAPVPEDYFAVDGVADYRAEGTRAAFLYRGDMMCMLEKIHSLGVEDVFLEEPSLDEIFLHYYR